MTLHRKLHGLVAGVLAAIVTALVPAVANAAPEWTRLANPPGGEALTTASGTPYVAYTSAAGVRVARPAPSGDAWQQVGGSIHHTSGAQVFEPDLAQAPDNRIWVTWTELDSDGTRQVRVARLDGSAWHEIVGGAHPINYRYDRYPGSLSTGRDPHLAFFGGTTWVVYGQENPVELVFGVVRLKADGSAWEHIDPSGTTQVRRPRAAVAGGRLFAAGYAANSGGTYLFRLNAAGTGWESINDPGQTDPSPFGEVADLNGVLGLLHTTPAPDGAPGKSVEVHSLGAGDAWEPVGGSLASSTTVAYKPDSLVYSSGAPYAAWLEGDGPASVEVSRFDGGAWSLLPSPSTPGADATLARLAESSAGVYVLWVEGGQARVAKLTDPVAPPPSDGGDDGSDDGGGDETPSGPPEPPPPPPTGHCSNVITGTALGDVLKGTALSDSISGGAGRDGLFGFAGDDCLFGGDGRDLLNGGPGGDTIYGGNGADELRGGSGDDDLNGRAGNDLIYGGAGNDAVGGGTGNDLISVRGGGSDVVACGSGRDVALIDRTDGTRGCERVLVKR